MINSADDNYATILLEDTNAKFEAILEIAQPLAALPAQVSELQGGVGSLQADMKVVKAAVTDTSAVGRETERRLSKLELQRG